MWAPVVDHVSAQIHPEEGNKTVTSVKSTRVSIRQNRKQMVRGGTQVRSWEGSGQKHQIGVSRWDAPNRWAPRRKWDLGITPTTVPHTCSASLRSVS